MNNKNKSVKVLTAVIIVLIALVIILGGSFVYMYKFNGTSDNDILNNNDNTTQEDSNDNLNKPTTLDINDDLVKNLWKLSGSELMLINGDDDTKIEAFYKNDETLVNNLSNELKAYLLEKLIIRISADNKNACYKDNGCDFKYWSSSVVVNEYNRIFGNTNSLKDISVGCSHYQTDYSLYMSKNCGGSTGLVGASSELIKATKSNNEIVLYQAVKFSKSNLDYSEITYYTDYEKTKPTTHDEKIDANYKRIFKKDNNDNYYFYSIEKIK